MSHPTCHNIPFSMFTGIIKGKCSVLQIDRKPGLHRITIELPPELSKGIEHGASIAIDGVCLTVSDKHNQRVTFDVMQETLHRTTLGKLTEGGVVNVERSISEGTEIGGHIVSGHVDCTATISEIHAPENNRVVTFSIPAPWMKYIFSKGFIALNGTSLTVTDASHSNSTFKVWFIPETLRLTTFGEKSVGDAVNLEIERNTQVIVDTTERFLSEHLGTMIGKP